jgi:hypothetical protein
MRKIIVGVLGWWLISTSIAAEQLKIVYKNGQSETGNVINTDDKTIFLEDSLYAVHEIPLADIESMFDVNTTQPVYTSELWRYRPRNSFSMNLLSTLAVYPTAEFEFVLNPLSSLALRGDANFQFTSPAYGGGFSYRFYPLRTAPRNWYLGPRADIISNPDLSLLTVKFEAGEKIYFENGFVFGYFFDVGIPIPTSGFGGSGAIWLMAYIVGGGVTIGLSF